MLNPAIEKRFENVAKSKTLRNIINAYRLDTKKVLDMGCSYGEFLSHFGPGSVGVTIINDEVEYAGGKGLNVIYGNAEDDNFVLNTRFDVLFCNNMFEHLLRPHEFLIKAKSFLNPGGILILGVPCIPKIVSLMHLNKFRGSLAGAHINFFTKDTLEWTVKKGGWNILETRGFRIRNRVIDRLLNLIYPHFYVVATMDPNFKYTDKRMRELAGYNVC